MDDKTNERLMWFLAGVVSGLMLLVFVRAAVAQDRFTLERPPFGGVIVGTLDIETTGTAYALIVEDAGTTRALALSGASAGNSVPIALELGGEHPRQVGLTLQADRPTTPALVPLSMVVTESAASYLLGLPDARVRAAVGEETWALLEAAGRRELGLALDRETDRADAIKARPTPTPTPTPRVSSPDRVR